MVIQLTSEIETALAQEAQRQGTTPERLALDLLGNLVLPSAIRDSSAKEASLLDFLAGYVGTIEGTEEALSEKCGEHFTEELVAKHERGHL